ncbi:transmembrane protein 198-like [Puntigrus tetrazona]|uniref:transmembrane protein 198-like n=1 Tax=Puntigrus tetrazona TaxID=1606681 RepID=UPI001C8AD382|nr:transmembrane protein 198-like [Puntigrus tetrazona]
MMNESVSESRVVCSLEIRREYELFPAVTCSLCFALGLVYCFCGCRCFRTVLLVSGLVSGCALGQLLCVWECVLELRAQAGVSLGLGLLGALLAVQVRSVGLFLSGLLLGALLSGAALLLLGQYYPVLSPPWAPVSAVTGTSLLFALLALRWRRPVTVALTTALGAAVALGCVDYWLETPMLLLRVYEGLQRQQGLCWSSWAVIGAWPLLTALGTLVQYSIISDEALQRKQCVTGNQKRLDPMRIRQKRERRPPALQRYAGDVLAPSYLASLRERQSHTGSSLWSLSSVHHTVIDFDSETGSLVPLTTSASALLRL